VNHLMFDLSDFVNYFKACHSCNKGLHSCAMHISVTLTRGRGYCVRHELTDHRCTVLNRCLKVQSVCGVGMTLISPDRTCGGRNTLSLTRCVLHVVWKASVIFQSKKALRSTSCLFLGETVYWTCGRWRGVSRTTYGEYLLDTISVYQLSAARTACLCVYVTSHLHGYHS
jgi:hypothetical protein